MLNQARLSLQQPDLWLDDPNSEYMKNIREETKAKLQSITGRMFQVSILSYCSQYSGSC